MNPDMKPNPDTQNQATSIQDRVFAAIEEKQVAPRSKYVFVAQNAGIWAMWLVTVVLGALATAVLVFTSTYRYYDIYEAMHDNFVTYFIQALPVVWIVACAVLMWLAARGLRATKRGYRLSPWLVGSSSVGLSVFFGFVASGLGFGHVVDTALGHYAPMYYSMAEQEERVWLQPEEGRLLGRMAAGQMPEAKTVTLIDTGGNNWVVDITELRQPDKDLLAEQNQVRVLGTQIAGESMHFHACGVFPWMMDKKRPMKELSEHRKAAVERLYGHMDGPADQIERLEERAFGEASASNTPSMKVCAEIAAVRRIGERMR